MAVAALTDTPATAGAPRASHGASVSIRNLTKLYGGVAAARDVSLEIGPGEFISILGPSGSGKTTTMMAIAGFIEDIEGQIFVGDRRIDGLPPHRREIGVVFQHLALFPHMTVAENVAYPLRLRGVPRAEISRRVERSLSLVGMQGFEARLPAQLSGGQQQRVAFARAVIFDPKVLLLDEPLAALDKKLRESLQRELRRMHRQLGITIILITHDQAEALAVSDRIAIMRDGEIAQVGTPAELYHAPRNKFVADFLGESTLIDGVLGPVGAEGEAVLRTQSGWSCRVRLSSESLEGAPICLMLRPSHVLAGKAASGDGNRFQGTIVGTTFRGDHRLYEVAVAEDVILLVTIAETDRDCPLETGARLEIGWQLDDGIVLAR